MSGARGRNPESLVTDQIRNTLHLLKVPHWKNAAASFGVRGIPDIIGCLPSGRMVLIEVKTPTGKLTPDQESFLHKYQDSGALTFVARSPQDVIDRLAKEAYEPAQRVKLQFVGLK